LSTPPPSAATRQSSAATSTTRSLALNTEHRARDLPRERRAVDA
jgi:hypothetical protein